MLIIAIGEGKRGKEGQGGIRVKLRVKDSTAMLLLGPCVVILFSLCDFNLALYLCPSKLGKLAQLVGTELIRHGTSGGINFTAPKQTGVLPETQVSYSNKSLIPEAIFDCSYEYGES